MMFILMWNAYFFDSINLIYLQQQVIQMLQLKSISYESLCLKIFHYEFSLKNLSYVCHQSIYLF